MLTAGGETTDRALASIFKNLLEHPEQLARGLRRPQPGRRRVRRDAPLLAAGAHDHAPDGRDVEIEGVEIPAGSTITCMLAAANRDPRKFADPDRFDIFRTDNDTRRAFTAVRRPSRASSTAATSASGRCSRGTRSSLPTNHLLDHMQDLRCAEGSSRWRRASSPARPTTSRSRSSPRSATGSGRTGAGARAQAGVEGLTASRACKTSGAGPSFRGILSARMSATIPALVASAKAAV